MNARPDSDPDLDEDDIPDASELLDFELIAKSQPDRGQGLWLWVVLVLILAGGGWAGWMYLQDDAADEMASADGVPLITAPKFEIREKPTDPGGMSVPDRDKLVYDRMSGEGAPVDPSVERLLPPPETPIEPPQEVVAEPPAPQGLVPQDMMAPDQGAQGSSSKVVVDMPPPAPVAPPKVEAPPAPPAPVAVAPEPAPAPAVPSPSAPAPAPQPAPTKSAFLATGTAGQGFLIQLSAVRTEEAAKSEWARIAKQHPDVLGGLDAVIQRADLGAKGIFYRVRGGWFTSRNEAKAICDELTRRNVGCIVAKP